MIVKATKDQTWDIISFNQLGNEFLMDDILKQNSYYYDDVVVFNGGETLTINQETVVETLTISSPWG